MKNTDSIQYAVITPARNEELNIEKTIRSMINQQFLPSEWIIVDDGSVDKTADIVKCYTQKYAWIKYLYRTNRGYRKAGGGVIDAFYDGYNSLSSQWDFLIKLDADLEFDKFYFQECFAHFHGDSRLGIGGGKIYHNVNGTLISNEKNPKFHVRGATKIYRKQCWEDIEGLIKAPGWDTIDEVKANMHGWSTRTFDDLPLTHGRYTGAADGTWKNWKKNGRANYICGYHPLFMAFKCLKRIFEKPYLLVSAGLFTGYVEGYVKKIPQINEPDLIKYLRKQQLNKILFKPTIWK